MNRETRRGTEIPASELQDRQQESAQELAAMQMLAEESGDSVIAQEAKNIETVNFAQQQVDDKISSIGKALLLVENPSVKEALQKYKDNLESISNLAIALSYVDSGTSTILNEVAPKGAPSFEAAVGEADAKIMRELGVLKRAELPSDVQGFDARVDYFNKLRELTK